MNGKSIAKIILTSLISALLFTLIAAGGVLPTRMQQIMRMPTFRPAFFDVYIIVCLTGAVIFFLISLIFIKAMDKGKCKLIQLVLFSLCASIVTILLYRVILSFVISNRMRIREASFYIMFFLASIIVFFIVSILTDKFAVVKSADDSSTVKIAANEDISQRAQYTYQKLIEEHKGGALTTDETVEAKLFAQAIETQLLKSPASAQFCDLEEMTVTPSGTGYIVSGYVDSQNSYAAMVRTPFKITVFKENDTWKCSDKIVSTQASIQKKVAVNYVTYLIIGVISTLLLYFFFRFVLF